ncbi:MAG: hypothetical protein ACYC9M_10860 [Desulfobulbaceae bacterium]
MRRPGVNIPRYATPTQPLRKTALFGTFVELAAEKTRIDGEYFFPGPRIFGVGKHGPDFAGKVGRKVHLSPAAGCVAMAGAVKDQVPVEVDVPVRIKGKHFVQLGAGRADQQKYQQNTLPGPARVSPGRIAGPPAKRLFQAGQLSGIETWVRIRRGYSSPVAGTSTRHDRLFFFFRPLFVAFY